MKSVNFIFGAFVLIVVTVHGQMDENLQKFAQLVNHCVRKENASEEDVRAIEQWRMPSSREGHCMAACIGEHMGIIQDGKYVPEGMLEGSQIAIHPNAPDRDIIIAYIGKMARECGSVENEDTCQLIVDIFDCMAQGS